MNILACSDLVLTHLLVLCSRTQRTFSDQHNTSQKDDYLPIFCGWWGVNSEAGVFRDYLLENYFDTHVSEYVHVGSSALSDYHIWCHDDFHSTSFGYTSGCSWEYDLNRSGIFGAETAVALSFETIGSQTEHIFGWASVG